ncbi:MAG: metallophosphoesterase [Thermotogota bacterium]|nr:metallophosphoesterase [Thermotogota bacterium]
MKKYLIVAFFAILSVLFFSADVISSYQDNYILSNNYLTAGISKGNGYITLFKSNEANQSLFTNHKILISGVDFQNSLIETSKDSISFIYDQNDFKVVNTYTLQGQNLLLRTMITNKTETKKRIQMNEIIDYSDTFPFFIKSKILNNYVLVLQQDYGSFGYFPDDDQTFQRVIANDEMTTSISFFILEPENVLAFTRVITVGESVSEIEKRYYDKFGIDYTTIEKNILLSNEKSAESMRVVLEDELGTIQDVQLVDEKGKVEFYLPNGVDYDNFQIKVDFGNLKTGSISLLGSEELFVEVGENYFFYQPFLTNKEEDGVTINFRMAVPARSTIEVYDSDNEAKVLEIQNEFPLEYHYIELSGLQPDSSYEYVINVEDTYTLNDVKTEKKSFKTKPLDEDMDAFRFIVYGDTQIYDERHAYVVNRIVEDSDLNTAFILKPGDHTEEGTSEKSWSKFFESAYPLSSKIPYYMVLGNHERNSILYYRAFELPSGGGDYSKRWYSFDYGNSHFVILDSNILESSNLYEKQMEWLEEDLKNNNDKKFIFVSFHHPFWTTATEYGSMEENLPEGHFNAKNWLPIFEKYGVDVVINGHIHAYERYFKNGIMFVTSGGGGAKLNTNHGADPLPWHVKHVLGELHYIIFDVYEDSIKVTVKAVARVDNPLFPNQYTSIDEVIDEFYIYKK